jgi:hypothetical protein
MDRRSFIQGAFAIPIALAIPKLPYAPPELKTLDYTHVGYKVIYKGFRSKYGDIGDAMARALANSMRQTMEQTAANVLSRAFEIQPITAEEMLAQSVSFVMYRG